MALENKAVYKSSSTTTAGSSWDKVLEAQTMRRMEWTRMTRRISMKRRAFRATRPVNGIERKVRTLKKLVPNGTTMDLDELFTETADYILSLQMRVKAMAIMAKLFSISSDDQ